MSANPIRKRFQLTVDNVKRLLSEELSDQEVSDISTYLLALLCDNHHCILNHSVHSQIIKLLILKSAQLARYQNVSFFLQLLDPSVYPTNQSAHFKYQEQSSSHSLRSLLKDGWQKSDASFLKSEFQNFYFLQEIVNTLLFEINITNKLRSFLSTNRAKANSILNILLILEKLLKIICIKRLMPTLIQEMHEIQQWIDQYIQNSLHRFQVQEICSIVTAYLEFQRHLCAQQEPISPDQLLMYKLRILLVLIKQKDFKKSIDFFNLALWQLLQFQNYQEFNENIKQILCNITEIVLFESEKCYQIPNLANFMKIGLSVYKISIDKVGTILKSGQHNPMYEILLLNYHVLPKNSLIYALNHFGQNDQMLKEIQANFLKDIAQNQSAYLPQILEILTRQFTSNQQQSINKRQYLQRNIIKLRVKYVSVQESIKQLSQTMTIFLNSAYRWYKKEVLSAIEQISISIISIYQKISKQEAFNYEYIFEAFKNMNIHKFIGKSIYWLQFTPDFSTTLSIINKLLEKVENGSYLKLNQCVRRIFSNTYNQFLELLHKGISEFKSLYQYTLFTILNDVKLINLTKVTSLMVKELLAYQESEKFDHQGELRAENKCKMAASMKFNLILHILKQIQLFQIDIVQQITYYLESLPSNDRKQAMIELIKVTLNHLQILPQVENNLVLDFFIALSVLINRLYMDQSAKEQIYQSIYQPLFNLLDQFENKAGISIKIALILEKIHNPDHFINILKGQISYLKKISNISFDKYTYLVCIFLIVRREDCIIAEFMKQSGAFIQQLITLYIDCFKKRKDYNLETDHLMNTIVLLINVFIEECFMDQNVKDVYSQMDCLDFRQISTILSNHKQCIDKCSFADSCCIFFDEVQLDEKDFQLMEPLQSRIVLFFYFKRNQSAIQQGKTQYIVELSLSPTPSIAKIWIFMINYVCKSKQALIQYCWKKIKSGNLQQFWFMKFIITYRSNQDNIIERICLLLDQLLRSNSSNLQTETIQMVVDVLNFPYNLTVSQYGQLFQKVYQFVDRWIFRKDNGSKYIYRRSDVDYANNIIQILHNLSSLTSASNKKIYFSMLLKLMQVKRIEQKSILRQKLQPTNILSFADNSLINVIIQLFSSSKTFLLQFFKVNYTYERNPLCYVFQKLLVELLYGNSSLRTSDQFIKQIRISMREQDSCQNWMEYMLTQVLSTQNNKFSELFAWSYKKQKGCNCKNGTNLAITKSFHFPLSIFDENEIPKQCQQTNLSFSKYQQFCHYCFKAEREIYKIQKMPVNLMIWQQQTITSNFGLAKKRIMKGVDIYQNSFSITYNLVNIILTQQQKDQSYLCAKMINNTWYLLNHQQIRSFSSISELLVYFKAQSYQVVGQMYEAQQHKRPQLQIQWLSKSSQDHLVPIILQNHANFIQQLSIDNEFVKTFTDILQYNIFDKRLYQNSIQSESFEYQKIAFMKTYIENYIVDHRLSKVLIYNLPSFIEGSKLLIRQNGYLHVNKITKNIKYCSIKQSFFYQNYFYSLIVSCFQDSCRSISCSLSITDQKATSKHIDDYDKSIQFSTTILQKILAILKFSNQTAQFAFALSILVKLCNQFKQTFAELKIFKFFITNSIISIFINRLNDDNNQCTIDASKFSSIGNLSSLRINLSLDMKINMIIVIDGFLRYQIKHIIEDNTSEYQNLLASDDQYQLNNTNFIEKIVVLLPNIFEKTKLLDSILKYDQVAQNQTQRKLHIYQIIIAFLHCLQVYQKKGQIQKHPIMLDFILRHITCIQELEMLLGCSSLDCSFANYEIHGSSLRSITFIDIIKSEQFTSKSACSIFLIHLLLKFIQKDSIGQIQGRFVHVVLSLAGTLEEVGSDSQLRQNFKLNEVQINKVQSTLKECEEIIAQFRVVYQMPLEKNSKTPFPKNKFQIIQLIKRENYGKKQFTYENIEINIIYFDAIVKKSQTIHQFRNFDASSLKQQKIQRCIQVVQITCFCQQPFEYLIKINLGKRPNLAGPSSIYLKSSLSNETQVFHMRPKLKKTVIFIKKDGKKCANLQIEDIMIE